MTTFSFRDSVGQEKYPLVGQMEAVKVYPCYCACAFLKSFVTMKSSLLTSIVRESMDPALGSKIFSSSKPHSLQVSIACSEQKSEHLASTHRGPCGCQLLANRDFYGTSCDDNFIKSGGPTEEVTLSPQKTILMALLCPPLFWYEDAKTGRKGKLSYSYCSA